MKNISVIVILFGCIFAGGCRQNMDEGVEIVMIDGIKHIQNPAEPIKGTIVLELEKKLEINPYDYEEIGFNYYQSVKDPEDGEVMLFDVNGSEAHRFSGEGEYQGSLIRHGEGPGEFPPRRIMYVHFVDGQIWVTGNDKLAKFAKSGEFIDEFRLDDTLPHFIDNLNYLSNIQWRDEHGVHKRIVLKNITEQKTIEEVLTFLEADNVGMIMKPGGGGGFGDDWSVPNIDFAFDPEHRKLFLVYASEYRITAKDLKGNTLFVIVRPYEPVKVSRADVKTMLPWVDEGRSKWIFEAYPDKLVAITKMFRLPHGFLAVYRVSGLREDEIDIYDPDGRYVYVMELPEGMELRRPVFLDFGFSTIEDRDDIPVYVEYRVKNLPDIFSEN